VPRLEQWEYTLKQRELIDAGLKPFNFSVGGVRSGKTLGALMYGVRNYALPHAGCDLLILRRKYKELETGAISDFRAFIDPELYDWNDTKKIATFFNGSRIVFGHCVHNREADIEQYLGQAYPFILIDECSQFSPDLFSLLTARNTVNPGCEPDADGQMPIPVIWGCTNPIGPFWLYYKSIFIDKKPMPIPEGAARRPNGEYWLDDRCIYDPANYAFCHSTVLDNPPLLARDPSILPRLNSLPEAKRRKLLLGELENVEGQYFDCFSPEHHVVSLRADPDAILWQAWQPVWAGWDWGVIHDNAFYLFTRALARSTVGNEYKLKTVCFREIVTQGVASDEMVALIQKAARNPQTNEPLHLSAIYFSHEKFNRQIEAHSPADVISRKLVRANLPLVSPATRDRIASAAFLYGLLQTNQLVVLDTCQEIIASLPTLMRNPDQLDDVLKVDGRADDCYDAFRYGLFGQLGDRRKPADMLIREKLEAVKDPFARHFIKFKATMDREQRANPVRAAWEMRMRHPVKPFPR
jgi:hypothetical protein